MWTGQPVSAPRAFTGFTLSVTGSDAGVRQLVKSLGVRW